MPSRVRFDEHRIAHVDGKPFFLVGARHMPEGGTPSILADAGFNACRVLAFGHESSSPNPLPESDFPLFFWSYIFDRAVVSRSPDYGPQLEKHVAEVKRHPQLLCYENYNEVAWSWNNNPPKALPAELEEGTRLAREMDPDHPIWLAHSCDRTVEMLAGYNGCMDILGCNPYPVVPAGMRQHVGATPDGRMIDCPDQTVHAVGKYTDKMRRVGAGRKPVWMLIQAMANENWFNPNHTPEMAEEGLDESKILYPTFEQMRFTAYDAIIAGATGLAFSMHRTPVGGKEWRDITRLVRELRGLEDALTAPPVAGPIEVSYDDLGYSIWDGVVTLMRRRGHEVYVFAANTAFDPARTTLRFPGITYSGAASVEGEDREVRVEKSVMTDDFEPYAVHVYRLRGVE